MKEPRLAAGLPQVFERKTKCDLRKREVQYAKRLHDVSTAGCRGGFGACRCTSTVEDALDLRRAKRCRSILAADPELQLALRLLGLSITDQFCGDPSDRYKGSGGTLPEVR